MLYLEDYLELLEQLPQDLRDRFTEVRELDLQVQNSVDFLDQRVRRFFQEARKAKKEAREQEYMKIKEGYDKALENAEEKVTMASQIYDLVERYLKKLDQELAKFKMELEADCAGITEILESRSLLYDESPAIDPLISSGTQNNTSNDKWHYSVDPLHAQNGLPHKDHRTPSPFQASYSPLATPAYSQPSVPSPGSIALSRSQVPSGSAALAIAAAQAVTNTFHQQQGRRGAQASLLASYATARKAEQLGSSLGSLLGTAATTLPRSPSFVDTLSSNSNYRQSTATLSPKPTEVPQASPAPQKMNRKRSQKASTTATSSLQASVPSVVEPPIDSGIDWVPDPNEPRYCLCNQVSYGEMVGCDNPDCPIEWFHYGCVGLTDAPKGKWYCPNCSAQIKKRRVR